MEQGFSLAGLGKLFVCNAEDLDKNHDTPMQLLGDAVKIEPGMLTYKDDDEQPSYSPNGFSTTFTGTMEEPSHELLDLLLTTPNRWDVKLERNPGRMPRKMKKGLCYGWLYRRNTKWKRKAGNYRRRLLLTLHNAEIVITKKQHHILSDVMSVEMEIHKAKEDKQWEQKGDVIIGNIHDNPKLLVNKYK